MGIIGWILLGLLAGIIAKAVLPGDDPGGFIVTTIIGIIGALLGGFIARALGIGDPIDEFFDISTWLAAIIGAIAPPGALGVTKPQAPSSSLDGVRPPRGWLRVADHDVNFARAVDAEDELLLDVGAAARAGHDRERAR
jgi:uncharacterized membrane protein YeaQ/YmgE (transglycosylase-associated protein family)